MKYKFGYNNNKPDKKIALKRHSVKNFTSGTLLAKLYSKERIRRDYEKGVFTEFYYNFSGGGL